MLRPDNHKRSRLQERRAATYYGGSTTPGSGNQWHSKADVKTPDYLIECKTTVHASYSLKQETMIKLVEQAILEDRVPLLEIELPDITCIVMDKRDFIDYENSHSYPRSVGES